MIGVGVGLYFSQGLNDESPVLSLTPEQQSDIVKLLVRYRIVRRFPWLTPEPCQIGTYCIRTIYP